MSISEKQPVAVAVSGVKKMYKLGQIGGGTLYGDLQSWWARVRGKEDPNSVIGEDQRSNGETFMALNGVDLTIHKGEAVGIIGSNGAGKSTLLKLLSRVTAPSEGEIDIYGRVASMLEVGTGFHGELTGRENVYMNGAILGMTKSEIDAKMEDIIEFSEVREFIDTPVKRYSSGMYVKLAFSVAAHLDAEIMIMDEVLAVGDINFQQKCLKKMRSVALEDGRTVLYVSHNMGTIKTLCNRCIVLDKGKIIFDGDVDEAIGIYSSRDSIEHKMKNDVSKNKRPSGLSGDQFVNVVYCSKNELDIGEPLTFSLEIDSKKDIKNGLLRFVLFNKIGEPIATTYSQIYELKKGKNLVRFRLITDELACGEYHADFVLCEYDGDIQIRQDVVSKAFAFYMRDNHLYNARWDAVSWGNIKLNEIKVEKSN